MAIEGVNRNLPSFNWGGSKVATRNLQGDSLDVDSSGVLALDELNSSPDPKATPATIVEHRGNVCYPINWGVTPTSYIYKNPQEVANWLNQFDTAQDKKTAMKILDNFTYIDLQNARKGYRKLYQDLLDKGVDMNKTKFATLGNAKSGSMMSYLFRQANKMRNKGVVKQEFTDTKGLSAQKDKFISYSELQDAELNKKFKEEGIENLVIVDDIIGDGDSLIEFFSDTLRDSVSQYEKIYYLTLVKDPDGEKRVKERFPNLNIEFLSAQEVQKYDSKDNKTFSDEEKEEIKQFIAKYDNKIADGDEKLVKKYSRSQLFVAFDWNCPGNTPMMFNYKTDKWNPLFERYNGLENWDVGTDYNFKL